MIRCEWRFQDGCLSRLEKTPYRENLRIYAFITSCLNPFSSTYTRSVPRNRFSAFLLVRCPDGKYLDVAMAISIKRSNPEQQPFFLIGLARARDALWLCVGYHSWLSVDSNPELDWAHHGEWPGVAFFDSAMDGGTACDAFWK